jgi:hypothetical protein
MEAVITIDVLRRAGADGGPWAVGFWQKGGWQSPKWGPCPSAWLAERVAAFTPEFHPALVVIVASVEESLTVKCRWAGSGYSHTGRLDTA